jgi:hypothetical protein
MGGSTGMAKGSTAPFIEETLPSTGVHPNGTGAPELVM